MSEIEPDNDTITILITHRYDMLKKSHHIVLMDDGTVSANGLYEELLNKSEQFRQLLQTKQKNKRGAEK